MFNSKQIYFQKKLQTNPSSVVIFKYNMIKKRGSRANSSLWERLFNNKHGRSKCTYTLTIKKLKEENNPLKALPNRHQLAFVKEVNRIRYNWSAREETKSAKKLKTLVKYTITAIILQV